jgi:hypothetical protein
MWAPCCACVTFKNNHMEKGVAYEIIVFWGYHGGHYEEYCLLGCSAM